MITQAAGGTEEQRVLRALGGIACAELDDEQLLYAGALIALDACAASTPSATADTGCAG